MPSVIDDVFAEMRRAAKGREFSSLDEVQAFTDQFTRKRNRTAIEDFQGLSPDQMHRLLSFPFSSPQLVSFSDRLDATPSAPIMSLFAMLVDAMGKKGLKPTAKGNLPQKLCREAARTFWGEASYRRNTRFGGINKEEDFIELNVTRRVAELAGLIRRYRGRFILSRDCRSLLAEAGPAGIYPRLLRTYIEKFNWGYWDNYPDIFFIQRSFLFTLYLLNCYGEAWMPAVFYEDCFLRAFPMVLNEAAPVPAWTPEDQIRSCYTLRALECFCGFLGLAEVEPLTTGPYVKDYRIMRRPLLNEAVHFHFQVIRACGDDGETR